MSDTTYRWACRICLPPFWLSSRPLVLHAERVPRAGGCILAATHLSPYDIALLFRHSPRPIDFMSTNEFGRKKSVAWIFSLFNTFYLDRSLTSPASAIRVVRRLQTGRLVGFFPEGSLRSVEDSLVSGGPIKPGIARLAQLAAVPVIACIVLGAAQYRQVRSWLPLRLTRYGVIYGPPLRVNDTIDSAEAREIFLHQLKQAYRDIGGELLQEMNRRGIGG